MGMIIYEDMDQMEQAVMEKNLDMKITGKDSEAEGLGSEDHNKTVAIQNLNLTLAI
jgi:hypothetical protein